MIDNPSHSLVDSPSQAAFERETEVIWAASQGQVSNYGFFALCVLFSWLLVPLLMMLWRYLATSMHRYEITSQRLLETSGVISRRTEELELYRVKDIAVEEPIGQRLFGRGRVVLHTSDRSTPIVTLQCICEPRAVAHLLRQHVERCRVGKGVREID